MKKITHCSITLIFAILCVFPFLTSCISISNKENVLQKSQEVSPDWINENGTVNSENKNYINVVFKRSDLYNLPLGIKQTQTSAELKTSYLMLDGIEKETLKNLNTTLTKKNKDSNALAILLSNAIDKSRRDVGIKPGLLQSVYWEYRQRDTSDGPENYYVVWVLLSVPKSDYEKAIQTTARYLLHSENAEAISLGKSMLQQINK